MGKNVRCSTTLCAVVAAVTILSTFRFTHCKDVVRGRVSSVMTSQSADQAMPSSLSVDVRLDGTMVHLRLDRDNDFQPDLPLYVLSIDSNGKEQIHRAKLKETEYAVYYDLQHEAAFGMSRERDSNGTSHYKLEGVVHSAGKIYDLKSTGQRQRARHRRDVQGDSNSDVNGDNNVDEEQQVEEEDFEVDVFSDPALDGSDSLPKPPVTQRRIVMRNMNPPLGVGPVPAPDLPPPHHPPLHRRRRQVTQDIYVDVVALADYGVYKSWYDRSTNGTASAKQLDTLEKLRRYYAFVMNGVNLLYKTITSLPYKIHVRLASVVVSTTKASSTWTERYRVTATQWDEVNANQALKAVSDWAATTDLLPAYDHLMLFSGYDLSKTVGTTTSDKITGLAYTATVCDTNGKAASVVEDLGGFQCIGTAAHELGHGLSAEHDGTENSCRSEDRYIMAAGTYTVTSVNKLNPWKFSSCSVNYFNNFFKDEVRFSRGRQCLYNSLTPSSNVPNVTSLVEGQLYDVDEQCRQMYGPDSRLCRGPEFGEAADVCTDMFCYDPTTTATCYQLVAARGTTCGNKKWCDSGECVFNNAAPAADESCVFGDQPGTAFDDKNCPTFVDNFPGYCYQDVVRVRCCASCAKHYRLLKDCEYGDRATGCSSRSCSIASTSYLESCCGTCNYGTPITTTTTITTTPTTHTPTPTTAKPDVTVTTTTAQVEITTTGTSTTTSTTTTTATPSTTTSTTTTTTTPVVTTPSPPTVQTTNTPTTTTTTDTTTTSTTTATDTTTTSSTKLPVVTTTKSSPVITTTTTANVTTTTSSPATTPPAALCLDNSSITINNMTCASLVRTSPELCYASRVITHCCQSCRAVATGVTGCEYGDHNPGRCSNITSNSDECSTLQPICCKTCAGYESPTGGQDVSADVTVSVILSFVSFTLLLTQIVL